MSPLRPAAANSTQPLSSSIRTKSVVPSGWWIAAIMGAPRKRLLPKVLPNSSKNGGLERLKQSRNC